MNKRRAAFLAAAIVWALLLAPFFLGAPAAHPATDDFTYAVYTHPTWAQTHSLLRTVKDAVSYGLRTWRDWQGTFTGVVLMALNPAVFSLKYYGVHAVLLLLLKLAADFVFIRHFFLRRLRLGRGLCAAVFFAVSAMHLLFLPDIVEGVFWFNGAWFYTGAQSVALLTLVLADAWSEGRGGRAGRVLRGALACLLLFALGMDNYITAMLTASGLALLALTRLWSARRCARGAGMASFIAWDEAGAVRMLEERHFGGLEEAARQKKAALRAALLLLPLLLGLALSVLAPGNAVRMAADGAHESGFHYAFMSVGRSFAAAARFALRFAFRTPVLALLLLLTPAFCRALEGAPEATHLAPPIPLTLLCGYLALCAMVAPHMYASGYAGSGRVVNMYHDYALLAWPLVWALILARLKPRVRRFLQGKSASRALAVLSAVLMAVCLLCGQLGNYLKLVIDQTTGVQSAYIQQFQAEYALCESAGPDDDVILPAWTVQTMTGKPTAYEDPAMWTNESMASYFGVRSVRVGE